MNETWLLAVVTIQTVLIFGLVGVYLRRQGSSADDRLIQHDLKNLDESVQNLRDSLSNQLGQSQQKMYEGLQKQFSESSKLITDVTRNLTELKETNKQVVDVTGELKTLQNILQNPKQRGVLGEFHLQTLLENVLPPGQFMMQHKFKDGATVDAVVMLKDGQMLPVDAKFSLENYNRIIEEKDADKRLAHMARFKADLKNRIDETATYIRPSEKTMDFAFMFIPSEAIYYDLLVNKIGTANVSARDLVEYAFRDKNVIIVSPTSFMAYLQTVLQGLRSLEIEEKAKAIQKGVLDLSRHIRSHADYMTRMGKTLSTTVGHYNQAYKSLGQVDKDVVKIAGSKNRVDPLLIDKPENEE
ncbi:MAG TPA: DNA recombination protein RmuC [Candidatus Saccharimonadales bacterium]